MFGKDDFIWYSRIFTLLILFLFLYLSYELIRPFISVILVSILFSYVSYPLYKLLRKKLNPTFSSLLIILLIVVVFIIPSIYLVQMISGQLSYLNLDHISLTKDKIINFCTNFSYCRSIMTRKDIFMTLFFKALPKITETSVTTLYKIVSNVALSLPHFLLEMILVLIFTFFFLKDGKQMIQDFIRILPLKKHYATRVFLKINEVMDAVIFGSVMTALSQAIAAIIIYFLLGIKAFLVLGLLTGFAAFIPYIGTATVWIPLAFWLIISGLIQNSSFLVVKGIGLIILGFSVITTIDDFLRPIFIGSKTKIHPLITIIGILGGVSFMGFLGVFYGPIILEVLLIILKISEKEWF